MPRIPTPEELGDLLRMPGSRPVGRYDVSPYAQGAQQIADAGTRFGQAVSNVGAAVRDVGRKNDQTQYVHALARGLTRGVALHKQLQDNPNYDAVESLWGQGADRIISDEAATIDNPQMQEALSSTLGDHFAEHQGVIARQAAEGRAQASRAFIAKDRQDLVDTLGVEPDPLHNAKVEVHNALIDTAARNGYLDHEAAHAEKRRTAQDLTVALYTKMGRVDPARALRELRGEDAPHPMLQYVPSEMTGTLMAHAEANRQADELDARRAERLALDQQQQRASDATESAMIKDLVSENPTVTAKSIVNNDALTYDAVHRTLGGRGANHQD
jgi:hypothetical protein